MFFEEARNFRESVSTVLKLIVDLRKFCLQSGGFAENFHLSLMS